MTRRMRSLLTGAGLVVLVALSVAACSSSGASSAPTNAPAASTPASAAPQSAAPGGATGAVTVKDFAFDPTALTVKVGQQITWTNTGNAAHTVTFDTGGVDSGTLNAGKTFDHVFDTSGTFKYHCNFHSSMQGTVTVTQ